MHNEMTANFVVIAVDQSTFCQSYFFFGILQTGSLPVASYKCRLVKQEYKDFL